MSERKRWTDLAAEHPFWTVLAEPRYRGDRIGAEDIREFFATGQREITHTLSRVRRLVDPDFHPGVSVDYGSGVGRLTLPIARESGRAIGVDLSEPMLRESRSNAEKQGVTNVEFVHADEFLSADDTKYRLDFVHSYIVLQHIHPRIGLSITDTLLRRLNVGGVAALHYTYARRASMLRRIVHPLRWRIPPLNVLANIIQRRPTFEPMIPMHEYDMVALFALFQKHGASEIHAELTDQGGHLGAMFIFKKDM